MTNYKEEIKQAKTIEELKAIYKNWAMKLHPDLSRQDTTKDMQELNSAYEQQFNLLQKTATAAGAADEKAEKFITIIDKLLKMQEIEIDLIGSWLWISGKTYPIKEQLKKLGFNWSKKRKKWYYAGKHSGMRFYGKSKTYEQLKSEYGCLSFTSNKKNNNKQLVGA